VGDDDDRFGGNPFEHRPRRSNGSNGHRPDGMKTRSISLDEVGEPLDLVAVQADDELINALAAGMTVSSPGLTGYGPDDRVAAILAAWKADVDVRPIPELVDVDTAVSTVLAARRSARRPRRLAPVAAAAAVVVLALGGLSLGSYNAQPNDTLWAVSKVLYSERAQSVEAAARVEQRITNAKQALVAGKPVVAAQELAQAQADLAGVRPEEGRTELAQVQEFLVAKAAETPPGTPTDPGTPLSTQPSRPVPPGAAVEAPGAAGTGHPLPWRPSGPEVGPSGTPTPEATPDPSAPWRSQQGRDPRDSTSDPRRQRAPAAPSGVESPGSGTSVPPSAPPTSVGSPSNPEPTTGPTTPPATAEHSHDPVTTAPAQSMGGTPSSNQGTEGSTGATAAGSATQQPTS
jgi:hypothetical protein